MIIFPYRELFRIQYFYMKYIIMQIDDIICFIFNNYCNNKSVIKAKINRINELSKLLSIKNRISDDLFHLFGKFGIDHLLSRLPLEK